MSSSFVKVWDNVVSDEILQDLQGYCEREVRWEFGSQSDRSPNQFSHWNYELLNTKPTNQENYEDSLVIPPFKNIWDILKNSHLSGHKLVRMYLNAHTYGTEGYPHIDNNKTDNYSTLLYLNPEWSVEWGGETLLFNECHDAIMAVSPKPGRAICFKTNILHAARSVSRRCPALRVCLVIKTTKSDGHSLSVDEEHLKFLKSIGTQKVPHSNRGTLLDHLIGTYKLLEEQGSEKHVCIAGLYHSIYGTTHLDEACLSINDRELLKTRIGIKAENLACLFSKLNRPDVFDSILDEDGKLKDFVAIEDLDNITIKNLLLIECANILEQKQMHRFPKLYKYSKSINLLDRHGLSNFQKLGDLSE